jgi:hypothetical protein
MIVLFENPDGYDKWKMVEEAYFASNPRCATDPYRSIDFGGEPGFGDNFVDEFLRSLAGYAVNGAVVEMSHNWVVEDILGFDPYDTDWQEQIVNLMENGSLDVGALDLKGSLVYNIARVCSKRVGKGLAMIAG